MVNEQCEHKDKFCVVCGLFTPLTYARKMNENLQKLYETNFKMDFVKAWYKPDIICNYCRAGLQKTPTIIKYELPMQWLNRSEHSAMSCYFCINNEKTSGIRFNTRDQIEYDLVDSVLPPVLKKRAQENQEEQQPMDIELGDLDMDVGAVGGGEPEEAIAGASGETTPPGASLSVVETESPPSAVDTSSTFQPDRRDMQKTHEPILFRQADVDNLAKELRLDDKKKELLGLRLADHNVVDSEFRVTAGRKRRHTQEIDEMYRTDNATKMTYCWNIRLLFLRMRQPHNPNEWRLFIDGGKKSLKAVLLHNTNVHP